MNRREAEKAHARVQQKALEKEQKLLLEFALAQKKDFLQAYLHKRGLAYSGNKDILRDRILTHIREYALSYEELAKFLDSVEGWGDQSIYLYQAPPGIINKWSKDQSKLLQTLKSNRLEHLINTDKPVFLPEKPTLSTILLTQNQLTFVWVEKHEWFRRDEKLDNLDNLTYELRGYRRHLERRITRFEIDLRSGDCILTIPALGATNVKSVDGTNVASHSKYQEIREKFEKLLEPVIGISAFSKTSLKTAIGAIEHSIEVLNRENIFETPEGIQFKLLSTISDKDIKADYRTQNVRKNIPPDSPGMGGSYKWKKNDVELTRDISVKLFGQEQRISIGVKCEESEVKYVLSRIRELNQNISQKRN